MSVGDYVQHCDFGVKALLLIRVLVFVLGRIIFSVFEGAACLQWSCSSDLTFLWILRLNRCFNGSGRSFEDAHYISCGLISVPLMALSFSSIT